MFSYQLFEYLGTDVQFCLSYIIIDLTGGDMEKIDYDTRIHLSKLLDPCKMGCDWQALADKLGLKKMMEGQIGEHSPTRLLLTYFEACGGTVSSLTNALSDLKRDDAINILMSHQPDSHSTDKDIPSDPKHDSGIESPVIT